MVLCKVLCKLVGRSSPTLQLQLVILPQREMYTIGSLGPGSANLLAKHCTVHKYI